MGIECDYNRSLRWCGGARLPRARRARPRPRRGSQAGSRAGADAERRRESSVTTSPDESCSTVHEWAETPRVQPASPESTIPEDDDTTTVPQSYPPEAAIEQAERGGVNHQLEYGELGPWTPTGSSSRREGSGEDEPELAELVAVRDAEPSWTLQTPLDGHLCSMLFQDDGSHLAYLYCKNPSQIVDLMVSWRG